MWLEGLLELLWWFVVPMLILAALYCRGRRLQSPGEVAVATAGWWGRLVRGTLWVLCRPPEHPWVLCCGALGEGELSNQPQERKPCWSPAAVEEDPGIPGLSFLVLVML